MNNAWIALDTQAAINTFMETYGYFHDGCLVDLHYVSGTYVDPEDMGMQPCADKRSAILTFHRQFPDPCIIELRFDGIDTLVLHPFSPLYTSEIHEARMRLNDAKIEWFSHRIDDESKQYTSPNVTWLRAEHGWWRPIQ